MHANVYQGMVVRITRGRARDRSGQIVSNNTTTLQLCFQLGYDSELFELLCSCAIRLARSGEWNGEPGAISDSEPDGSHDSHNGPGGERKNEETPSILCTVTRWVIGGVRRTDTGTPPMPSFGLGLSPTNGGTVEVSGVSFTDLDEHAHDYRGNTGTLLLAGADSWATARLAAAIGARDTTITLSKRARGSPVGMVQIAAEVAQVVAVLSNATQYQLNRGWMGNTAAAHVSRDDGLRPADEDLILPFVSDFFGSPASGSWSFPVPLADCRVASAELYVTNLLGNSPTGSICLTQRVDYGLRTLSPADNFRFRWTDFSRSRRERRRILLWKTRTQCAMSMQ